MTRTCQQKQQQQQKEPRKRLLTPFVINYSAWPLSRCLCVIYEKICVSGSCQSYMLYSSSTASHNDSKESVNVNIGASKDTHTHTHAIPISFESFVDPNCFCVCIFCLPLISMFHNSIGIDWGGGKT